MITSNIQLGFVLKRGGGQAVQGGVIFQHLLQEYLVERDINFISVNLRCLLQCSVGLRIDKGWGGKLSRAVYLAPRPVFQREWIISNFYYIVYFRNI